LRLKGGRPGVWEITLLSASSQIYDHLCVWKFPLNCKLLGEPCKEHSYRKVKGKGVIFLTGHIQCKQSLSPRSLQLRGNFKTIVINGKIHKNIKMKRFYSSNKEGLICWYKSITANFCKFVLTKFQVKIKSCCGTGSGEVIKPALIGWRPLRLVWWALQFGTNEYVYRSLNAWRSLYVKEWNCPILESVGINIVVGTATIWCQNILVKRKLSSFYGR
jgi:hypothetical protein